MIAEKYDPHHQSFWLTVPGCRPQRFGMGQLVCYLDDAIRAVYGGWRIIHVQARRDGNFVALVRKL